LAGLFASFSFGERFRFDFLPGHFLLLGFFAGGLGAVFLKLLRGSERAFQRLPLPLHWRMALGGLAVGAIAIRFPGVWGNGYESANQILHSQLAIGALAGLFLAKLLAILISVGSGAVGGVFTPTLFLGAGLGGGMFAYASVIDRNEMNEWAPFYLRATAVSTAIGALIGGRLADLFGRRKLLIATAVIFAAGAILCAAAPSGARPARRDFDRRGFRENRRPGGRGPPGLPRLLAADHRVAVIPIPQVGDHYLKMSF
jgi:H+/Cl- antiporter ClcA